MELHVRGAAAAFAAALAATFPASAATQPYPNKPVRLLVTYAAGGGSEFVSRIIAAKLSESFGQHVIVDPRPGGAGVVATDLLARSAPDGHTILHVDVAHGAAPALHAKLPYDTAKDFAPVTMLALLPTILVTHPSLPANSVGELITLIKAKPGQLNYASSGHGSATYLVMELFKHVAGIDLVQVPYKGGGPAITDVLGGQVPMMFISIPPALSHVKAGKLKVLMVSSAKRAPTLPDVPNVVESGFAGAEFNIWQAILAPRGTPANVIARLNTDIIKALTLPDVRERMAGIGAEVMGSTPGQLNAHIAAELARWSKTIKRSGRTE